MKTTTLISILSLVIFTLSCSVDPIDVLPTQETDTSTITTNASKDTLLQNKMSKALLLEMETGDVGVDIPIRK